MMGKEALRLVAPYNCRDRLNSLKKNERGQKDSINKTQSFKINGANVAFDHIDQSSYSSPHSYWKVNVAAPLEGAWHSPD